MSAREEVPDRQGLLSDLARVRALFQQRAVVALLREEPAQLHDARAIPTDAQERTSAD